MVYTARRPVRHQQQQLRVVSVTAPNGEAQVVANLQVDSPFTEAEIDDFKPRGIVLSGGPESATTEEGPKAPAIVFTMQVPVLGICYGLHTMAAQLGGSVEPSDEKEFGYAEVELLTSSALFAGIADRQEGENGNDQLDVWMSRAG